MTGFALFIIFYGHNADSGIYLWYGFSCQAEATAENGSGFVCCLLLFRRGANKIIEYMSFRIMPFDDLRAAVIRSFSGMSIIMLL